MSKIIDIHVHVGTGGETRYTAEDALRVMEANEIDMGVISPVSAYPLPKGVESSMEQNDNIAKALKQWPDRFVRGLGVVDPRHGKRAIPEVDRILGDLGLSGLMFENDKIGLTLDHPIMFEFLESAAKYKNVVVLAHTGPYSVLQSPFMLGKLARKFPSITFVNAQSLTTTTHANMSADLSATHSNVYLDTACTYYVLQAIKNTVRAVGEDKVLFGSDAPYYKVCRDKRIVEVAQISQDTRQKILYENAKRIFRI